MMERVRQVIAYDEDVHVWVYLDQGDRVLRYEAYVVGYDESGDPGTLAFVFEEGVLDNVHEVPLFRRLLREHAHRFAPIRPEPAGLPHALQRPVLSAAPLRDFYTYLSSAQLASVHGYFSHLEAGLKAERKGRWSRRLRALGYDVIPSLEG